MRAAIAGIGVLLLIGCSPNRQAGPTHVTVNPSAATQPASVSAAPTPRETPGRHVELTVRDPSAVSLSSSLVGKECRVQFRRDALGLASNSAVSPTQDWGGRMAVEGKIAALTDQWLVVTSQNKRYCIPLTALLMIEVQD